MCMASAARTFTATPTARTPTAACSGPAAPSASATTAICIPSRGCDGMARSPTATGPAPATATLPAITWRPATATWPGTGIACRPRRSGNMRRAGASTVPTACSRGAATPTPTARWRIGRARPIPMPPAPLHGPHQPASTTARSNTRPTTTGPAPTAPTSPATTPTVSAYTICRATSGSG